MAAVARLSPAASLLRNSRLFALPPALEPPGEEASTVPEGRSDTATSPYPTRASIETPLLSLNRGDWGLKRPLPLKSTTKTGSPVIRIQGGIDTREHIADFESAADHALTLKKWQMLHMPMSAPIVETAGRDTPLQSIFEPAFDNTSGPATPQYRHVTGVWPNEAPTPDRLDEPGRQPPPPPAPKRWRYDGPWLAGMSGMEFDEFVKGAVRLRREEFRNKVKTHMIAEREAQQKSKALEEGKGVGNATETVELEESDIREYMRRLRTRPDAFGTLIAEFLDLPDGPQESNFQYGSPAEQWQYGRSTAAARVYREVGPPVTHPSAGLSYLKVGPKTYARNDAVRGPRMQAEAVQSRVLRTKKSPNGMNGSLGVAGVIANNVEMSAIRSNLFQAFAPKAGGHKRIVRPVSASVNSNGSVNLNVKVAASYRLEDDDSVVPQVGEPMPAASGRRGFNYQDRSMPQLDTGYQRQRSTQNRSEPSTSTSPMIDDLKKAFDPFSNRSRYR